MNSPSITAMLKEFHDTFVPPGDDVRKVRATLLDEEHAELQAAIKEGNLLHVAQELADLVYVTYGTALVYEIDMEAMRDVCRKTTMLIETSHKWVQRALNTTDKALIGWSLATLANACTVYADHHGIDLDAAVAEVHRANMTKLGPNGEVLRRADGKILKGNAYTPPNMRVALLNPTEVAV